MKKSKVLSAVLVCGLSLSLANSVFAEETPNLTTQPTDDSTVKQDTTVTESQVKTAEGEYNEAKSSYDSQADVVKEAKKQLEGATEAKDLASQNLSEAKDLANQATPETIETAKTEVKAIEGEIAKQEAALTEAQANQAKAEEHVTDQEGVVAQSGQTVKSAEGEVKSAQTAVNNAKALLDGTGAQKVIDEADKASTKLATDEAKLVEAQLKADEAKLADGDRQLQIDMATIDRDSKQATLTITETRQKTATENLAKSTKAVEEATPKLATLKNAVDGINTIKVSTEYVEALKEYNRLLSATDDAGKQKRKEVFAKLQALSEVEYKNNVYKANKNDSTTKIDTNNLSEENLKELAFFAQDLVNDIRKAFGHTNVSVSSGSVKFADDVTDNYVADKWSWDDVSKYGHDAYAIAKAAQADGLKFNAEQVKGVMRSKENQSYENLNSWKYESKTISMANAKEMVFTSVLDFMFNGLEFAHARSIAGFSWSKNLVKQYLGVDMSTRDQVTSVHFLLATPEQVDSMSATKFDEAELVNPISKDKVLSDYEAFKTKYEGLVSTREADKATLTKAIQAVSEAKQDLEAAKDVLKRAEAIKVLSPEAQTKLTEAQKQVESSRLANDKAQEAVKALTADIKAKQKVYDEAKALLADKEAKLAEAKQVFAKDSQELARLKNEVKLAEAKVFDVKAALATAKQSLADKLAHVEKLTHAPEELEKALLAYTEAEKAYNEALSTLTLENDKLISLQQDRDVKFKIWQDLLAKYNKQEEAKRLADTLKHAEETEVRSKAEGKSEVIQLANKATTSKVSSTVQSSTLPSTGESKSSFVLVGLLMLVSMFGLFITGRRKEN
ncbi:SEC10/PgrA surface exclusion domain-containing protein [Streptococcus gallolyticus]|nr:SEC10/PgrA surface exclusion domain-containing protein [Streptococcus gallolyticus]MBY5040697.1 SEC10/PgrA surface exclusion domain-containing protein [Streptococcus gallolyticus]